MPVKSRRSWTPLWGFWPVPVFDSYGGEDEGKLPESSCFESVEFDDLTSLWSQRIMSDALAMLALAPASAHEQTLHVELGQDDRDKEHELDIMITELSASGIVVRKCIGDKQHTIWRVRTSTDSASKPTWCYRYPRKPSEVIIPPNPNTSKDNGPPRKTRRSIRRKFERSMIMGRSEITSWKRGAGRSKAWRKYRDIDINELQTEKDRGSESHQDVTTVSWLFSTSAVPLSLLRAQGKNPIQGRRKQTSQRKPLQASDFRVKLFKKKQKPEIARRIRWQRNVRASWKRHFARGWRPKPLRRNARTIRVAPIKSPKVKAESTADFLRLVVGFGGETKIVPEKFLTGDVTIPLSTDLEAQQEEPGNPEPVPQHVFSVSAFLRHDSHADVYALKNFTDPLGAYEGHLFFHEDMPGNWGKYGRRKIERLQRNQTFIGETRAKERILVIVAIPPDEAARTKKSDAKFPVLPKTDTGMSYSRNSNYFSRLAHRCYPEPSSTKSRPKKKKRPSYAAIAGRSNAGNEAQGKKHPSNHKAYQAWENREKTRKDSKAKETDRCEEKEAKATLLKWQRGDLQQLLQSRSGFASANPFTLLSV
jgi:hypothetical protein